MSALLIAVCIVGYLGLGMVVATLIARTDFWRDSLEFEELGIVVLLWPLGAVAAVFFGALWLLAYIPRWLA